MNEVRMKGRSVDEAVDAALQVLGIAKEEASVKVIKEGKSGILGVFGGEEAEVEVSQKGSSAEKGKAVLQDILDKAGFTTIVSVTKEEKGRLFLEVKGEDLGRIIGRDGAALDALQTLVSSILSRGSRRRELVTVDAADYRKRREEKLGRIAREAVDDAIKRGGEVSLPPMSAVERRAVHIAVKEDGRASSISKGEGASRRVVITPTGGGSGEGARP
jgi:spoIIIJ-associated protein